MAATRPTSSRTVRSPSSGGAPASAPFFLWTTYVAPHTGRPRDLADPLAERSTVPAARHRWAFMGAALPRPPSFDEADVWDKPPRIQRRPRLADWEIAALADAHRQRLASLAAVDEGVARIVGALRAAGELRRTLLVFTSDNGFLAGQHRIRRGKVLAYEPSIRVPLLMRGPGLPRGVRRRQLVWNGDLAPTILDLTGARTGVRLDGRSLLPLARSPAAGRGREILLEGPPGRGTNGMPRFRGLRTARYKFVKHVRGATELYDLEADPDETAQPRARAPRGVGQGAARPAAGAAGGLRRRVLPLNLLRQPHVPDVVDHVLALGRVHGHQARRRSGAAGQGAEHRLLAPLAGGPRRGAEVGRRPVAELVAVEELQLQARELGQRQRRELRGQHRQLPLERLHEPYAGPVRPGPRLAVAPLGVDVAEALARDVEAEPGNAHHGIGRLELPREVAQRMRRPAPRAPCRRPT